MAEDRTGVVARLDALEAAHKAATPGVWSVYWGDHIGSDVIQVEGGVRMRHEVVTLDDWRDQEDHEHPDDRTRDNPATEQDDAAAIVAEHNTTPALIAAVRGVLALAEELSREAAERQAMRDRLPDAPMYALERAKLLGNAAMQRNAAFRLRSTVVAALGEA